MPVQNRPPRRFSGGAGTGRLRGGRHEKLAALNSISRVLLAGGAMAEDASHTNVIAPDAVKWTENPAFPKGIQIATLVGDPTKAGETVVQRIKFPPKLYNAAAHPSLLGGRDGHQRQYRDEVARSLRRKAACCSQDQCGCTRQSTRTMHGPEMERPSCRSSTPARAASSTSTRLTIHARFDRTNR